jgi:hypothetical protein
MESSSCWTLFALWEVYQTIFPLRISSLLFTNRFIIWSDVIWSVEQAYINRVRIKHQIASLISASNNSNSQRFDWHHFKYSHRRHIFSFWRAAVRRTLFHIRLLSIPMSVINSVYLVTVVRYLFSVWKYINISHGLHIFPALQQGCMNKMYMCVEYLLPHEHVDCVSNLASFAAVSQVLFSVRN